MKANRIWNWTEESKQRVSGSNSGLYRGRLAGVIFADGGDGLRSTPEKLAIVKILIEEGLITEELDAACPEVKRFRGMGKVKKIAILDRQAAERKKLLAAVKARFGVSIDSPSFDQVKALEKMQRQLHKEGA